VPSLHPPRAQPRLVSACSHFSLMSVLVPRIPSYSLFNFHLHLMIRPLQNHSALSLSLLTFILFSPRPFSLLLSPVASCLNEMPFSQASRGSLVLLIIYRLRIRAFQSSSHVRGRFAATLCPHGFTVFIQPFATMCLQRSSSYLGSPFEFLLYANDILRRSVTGTFF